MNNEQLFWGMVGCIGFSIMVGFWGLVIRRFFILNNESTKIEK